MGNCFSIHSNSSSHIPSNSNSHIHSNSSRLCAVLRNQYFEESEGPSLNERLQPDQISKTFGKIRKNLYCLMGNGNHGILTIPEIVAQLLPRNYPELVDFDDSKRLMIFVPEWYLAKAAKYVEPSRGPQLQEYSERLANLCPERRRYFEDLKKFYMAGQRTHRGELPEQNLYVALQAYFKGNNENVAVFHGIDILKINLDRFKVKEKDFVIINATRRCILVIEVKRTLGAGDSIEKSIQQLNEAKEDLEAWFATEGLHHWLFIPMIYTEKIDPTIDCNKCNEHVIEGSLFLIHSVVLTQNYRILFNLNS